MGANLTDFASHRAAITALRYQVFVIEQKVPAELEQDGKDSDCQHAIIFKGDELIATGRLTPDGHLGRIAVARPFRGKGFGIEVIAILERAALDSAMVQLELAAQLPVVSFYEKLGYHSYGEAFFEAGIEHIHMNKVLNSPQP